MLEEAIRGEKAAVEEYDTIIADMTLPPSTNSLLTKHRDNVQTALNKVSAMESIA
ncbi:ferritin family protein [Nonlabens ulvanivorans]